MTATAPPGAPGGGAARAAGEVLAQYLSTQATELLRGLRDLPAQDVGGEAGPAAAAGVAWAIHDAAFRIADTLGSFRPLLDPEWAERLEAELYWLGHTVIREHVYAARRDRLVGALRRLSGEDEGGDLAVGDAGALAGGAADRGRVADVGVGGAGALAGGGGGAGALAGGSGGADVAVGGAGARVSGAAHRGTGDGLAVGGADRGTVTDVGVGGAGVLGTDRGRAGHVADLAVGGAEGRGAGNRGAAEDGASARAPRGKTPARGEAPAGTAGGAVPGARSGGAGGARGASAGAATGGRSRDGSAGYASDTSPSAAPASNDPASDDSAAAGSASRASGSSGLRSGASASARPAPGRVAAAGARRTGVATVPARPAAGAARAGALLERRLGLARSRAHSEALDALTSARYHALADAVALLVSDAPLTGAARRPAAVLPEHHDELRRVLAAAVAALPLARAGRPYNAAALARGLAAPGRADTATGAGGTAADDRGDAPWRHVHALVRRARHAAEVLAACPPGTVPVRPPGPPLPAAGAALDRDREAVEAAAAAASAAATPRIAPATAYALGVLHADQRHEVEAARFTFGRLWQTRGELK